MSSSGFPSSAMEGWDLFLTTPRRPVSFPLHPNCFHVFDQECCMRRWIGLVIYGCLAISLSAFAQDAPTARGAAPAPPDLATQVRQLAQQQRSQSYNVVEAQKAVDDVMWRL